MADTIPEVAAYSPSPTFTNIKVVPIIKGTTAASVVGTFTASPPSASYNVTTEHNTTA